MATAHGFLSCPHCGSTSIDPVFKGPIEIIRWLCKCGRRFKNPVVLAPEQFAVVNSKQQTTDL